MPFKITSFMLDEYGDDTKSTEVITTYLSHRSKFHCIGVDWISYNTHTVGTIQDEGFMRFLELHIRAGRFSKSFTLIDKPRPPEYQTV